MRPEILYRPASLSDIPFIFDSWLRSWRKSPWAGVIPNNLYYTLTRQTIEQLVARGAEFIVAVYADNPDHILGWVCCETLRTGEAVVHYLYVKDAYIPLGIGDALVEQVPGDRPGFYTFRYRQVYEACHEGFAHAPEIARRK